MSIISYRCLEAYHANFIKHDKTPKVANFSAFEEIMKGDYSGENLVSKLIEKESDWETIIFTKGLGQRKKFHKMQGYRSNLISTWKNITETVNSRDEREISKMMAKYLWNIEGEFLISYLGLIEMAMRLNLLWKNSMCSAIFCNFFGFVKEDSKSLDEIARENGITFERIRQIKELAINNIQADFWFLKDDLLRKKILQLFDLTEFGPHEVKRRAEIVNRIEHVNFSPEFYTILLSLSTNLNLVGNILDLRSFIKRSSLGNVWKSLYLQTPEEKRRCDIENLINALAVEMHQNNYYFKTDKVFDMKTFSNISLKASEIENYNFIILQELEIATVLTPTNVIIKRNSIITQPEMVEHALIELDGFAYADDILQKLKLLYADKDWSMPILRASFRGEKFYSIGKSGLFGLSEIKDVRPLIGDGTLNMVMQIYILNCGRPVHYYELLKHINTLFPRPKSLHAVHTILEQDSKGIFRRFEGGFYGISEKEYANTRFPRVAGVHGKILRQLVRKSAGVSMEEIRSTMNNSYELDEIQIEYLVYKMILERRAILNEIDNLYYLSSPSDFETVEMHATDVLEEIEVEISEDELDLEELEQFEIPYDMLEDPISQVKVRRGQPRFRLMLLKLYNNTCIVTGCKITQLLEAAHISPHSAGSDYRLSNGLLLRADIHTLFDLDMLAINPETFRLKMIDTLRQSEHYAEFDEIDIQKRLSMLNPKYKLSDEGLRKRWDDFIELG